MVNNEIDDKIVFEIDITEMLREKNLVIVKIIKDGKIIKIDTYKRRKNVNKKRTYEN